MGLRADFWKKYGALPALRRSSRTPARRCPSRPSPAEYYLDLMLVRHQEASIKASMKKAQEQLQPGGEGRTPRSTRSPRWCCSW